jgi:hypothetical protein
VVNDNITVLLDAMQSIFGSKNQRFASVFREEEAFTLKLEAAFHLNRSGL